MKNLINLALIAILGVAVAPQSSAFADQEDLAQEATALRLESEAKGHKIRIPEAYEATTRRNLRSKGFDDPLSFLSFDELSDRDLARTSSIFPPTPEAEYHFREIFENIKQRLNSQQLEIAVLQGQGYTHREISQKLGITETQVQSQLRIVREGTEDLNPFSSGKVAKAVHIGVLGVVGIVFDSLVMANDAVAAAFFGKTADHVVPLVGVGDSTIVDLGLTSYDSETAGLTTIASAEKSKWSE